MSAKDLFKPPSPVTAEAITEFTGLPQVLRSPPSPAPALPSPDLAKEIGDAVSQDEAAEAPFAEDTLDATSLSVTQVRSLCPKTFRPNDDGVRFVQAYVCAAPGTSMAEVARSLGIQPRVIRNWLYRHSEVRAWIQACLMASGEPGSVWKALRHRALKGSDRAAHMYLMRYDQAYAGLHRSGPPSRKKPTDKDLEQAAQAADAALKASEDGA